MTILKGYRIKGSLVRGTNSLIFKRKAEASRFARRVGGRAVKGTKKF